MNIVCVIPARAESSRFFEKPLALILGKPMIRWVWEHCKEVEQFSEVYVATDSEKIKALAESFGAKVVMTASDHDTATERLYEVSTIGEGEMYVCNLMTDFHNPVEVVDSTNLKIVTGHNNRCLFISRSPIPYPKGNMDYVYHKFVGVGAFNHKALEFYHTTPRGPIEKIEENDSFRFIENNVPIYYYNCHCRSLSVDNHKDIAGVEAIMKGEME